MEQWIISLVPILLSTAVILLRIGRDQQRLDNLEKLTERRFENIEKRLNDIHNDVLKKEVFELEVKGVTAKIDHLEKRMDRVERKVYNGAS